MKIGLFSDFYSPTVGGTETAINQYRDQLERLGHHVTIIVPASPAVSTPEPGVLRLPSIRAPKGADGHRLVLPTRANLRRLDHLKLDIVHFHTEFGLGILAHRLAHQRGLPHVHTVHTLLPEILGNAPILSLVVILFAQILYPLLLHSRTKTPRITGLSWRKRQAWSAMLRFYNTANFVIAPSQHLQTKLRNFGLIPPSSIHPNAIDLPDLTKPRPFPSDLNLPQTDCRIVCIGRLSPEKRQLELIKAFDQLPSSTAQLLIVGDGPRMTACRTQAAASSAASRIFFAGSRSHDQVCAILQHSDVFVLASHNFDNQPIVILEAISQGLPILYCDSNLKEGLTSNNALLTEPDATSLAAGLQTLVSSSSKRQSMARASIRLSHDFDYAPAGRHLINIYEKARNSL